MRISEIYNMDIYSDTGQYLGEVRDAIIDLERGEVSRLLMEEWRNSERDEAKKALTQKSVLFKNIKDIGDVVMVSATGHNAKGAESAASAEAAELMKR